MNALDYRLARGVRRYAGRVVLSIDELIVEPGEILGLVGPTGAGKSTLLRLLAALESVDEGEIVCGGQRFDAAVPIDVRRRITLVFQRPLLLSASVQANVEYGLRLRGDCESSVKARVMLDRLGLLSLAGRVARTLSGGETQLVALARALVLDPAALLLDEPTANLDPSRVALVEEVIQEYHRHRKATLVWATHNLFQARRVADRICLLLEGRIVELAEPTRFFENPADSRTLAFIEGRMVY